MIRLYAKTTKEITDGLKKIKRNFNEFLFGIVKEGSLKTERHLKEKLISGQLVGVRSGRYRASTHTTFNKPKIEGITGSKLIYARMIEFGTEGMPGGVMKAKKAGGWLAIPLDAAKTKAGVARKPKDFVLDHWRKARGGKLIMFGTRSGAGKARPLFVLQRQVKIKGKYPYKKAQEHMEEPLRKNAESRLREYILRAGLVS